MTLEVLKALCIIVNFCNEQNNCRTCLLKDLCAKMPCEW
jgi:hypothetical protein